MLDRLALEQKISQALKNEDAWFQETCNEVLTAWRSIQTATYKNFSETKQPIATWDGPLNGFTTCAPASKPYTIYAIDGSQIYPDRHFGVHAALINIGYAGFAYGETKSTALLGSHPIIYTRQDLPPHLQKEALSESATDALRSLHEFKYARTIAEQKPNLIVFDGSLIFWHLGTPENPAPHADYFLYEYLHALQEISHHMTFYCSYISAPKSRDLIDLIVAKNPNLKTTCYGYTDLEVLQKTLPNMNYTPVFKTSAPISRLYPERLHPYFVYLNHNEEIGRIEVPSWIAKEPSTLHACMQWITDQMSKGKGYPIALAEAHEQAVIREYDRQFVLQKLSNHNTLWRYSKKQIQKQRPLL